MTSTAQGDPAYHTHAHAHAHARDHDHDHDHTHRLDHQTHAYLAAVLILDKDLVGSLCILCRSRHGGCILSLHSRQTLGAAETKGAFTHCDKCTAGQRNHTP